MKKILLVLAMLIVLLMTGCNKDNTTQNNETQNYQSNQQQEETNNESVINYNADKKFVYLINNEVFATRVGNTWYNQQESVVTLKDLFDSEAFYSFDILPDTKQARTSVNTISINKFLSPYSDNKEWFNHVHSILGEENLLDVIETNVMALGADILAEQYIYKLPISITDNENIINRLNVYNTSREIATTSDLFSNDGNLKIMEPILGDNLSDKANEWLNTYLTDNNINISQELMTKSFKLNIDKDENTETVYLVYNEMTYPNVDEDKISLIILEDDEKIIGSELCKTTFRSQNDNEFWYSGYKGDWKENISLRFADFDHDGFAEILLDCKLLELESPDYHELYKISNDGLKLISEISGPGN